MFYLLYNLRIHTYSNYVKLLWLSSVIILKSFITFQFNLTIKNKLCSAGSPKNNFSRLQDHLNGSSRNVVVSSGVSSSNGTIVTIAGCEKLFVLTTSHGILQYDDGNVNLKGGQLSLETHDGKILEWLRVYFKDGLESISKSWDCCLIEIRNVPDIIPVSLSAGNDRLLSVTVQNFARIGSADHFLKGEVVVIEKEFAFIPMFTPSGASGCGLFTSDGRLVGIVQSTYDTANGIEITGDVYSAREVGTLFVKALTNSRHDPVLSRVLVCSQILEMYRDNPATIENSSDEEATVLVQERNSSHISSNGSTPDSKNVKRERTAKVIRGGEVVEVFSI